MRRASAALGLCAIVAACAAPQSASQAPEAPYAAAPRATNIHSLGAARAAVVPGRSTKADVLAALGKTTAIGFDSGYEVWIYLIKQEGKKETTQKTEFVVLFAPSGVVAKTRTR